MPYVLSKNTKSNRLEPLHVTHDEYSAKCLTIGAMPSKYGTKKAAQRVCDKINKTEGQNGTE